MKRTPIASFGLPAGTKAENHASLVLDRVGGVLFGRVWGPARRSPSFPPPGPGGWPLRSRCRFAPPRSSVPSAPRRSSLRSPEPACLRAQLRFGGRLRSACARRRWRASARRSPSPTAWPALRPVRSRSLRGRVFIANFLRDAGFGRFDLMHDSRRIEAGVGVEAEPFRRTHQGVVADLRTEGDEVGVA